MANRRNRIPGVTTDAERNINEVAGDLDGRLRDLERKAGRSGVVIADTAAKVGEFLNVEAPASGLTIILPEPLAKNRNARVTLSFRNANPVRLVSISGTVNRAPFVVNTAIGTFEAICDGELGWSVDTGLSSTGSATDAQHVLGAAHGSLPNGRVATDSTEVDAVLTTPNVISWVLRDGSVALGRLVPIADDTFLGNISGSSASPAAISFTSFAGDGIVYDAVNHQWDVVGSTSITVTGDQVQRSALTGAISAALNSNATLFAGIRDNGSAETARTNINVLSTTSIIAAITQDAGNDEQEWTWQRAALTGDVTAAQNSNATAFRSFAAKSVLANATNASAIPSDLAGSAAFQYVRVNSANTALEWSTLATHASTSILYSSNTFERAALTGAIAASQNSNATLFAGIRDNGSAENDRTNLNFLSGTFINVVVTDDAVNDELEISASLAPVSPGRVYGYQVDGAGTGIVALTGAEIGELIRFGFFESFTLAPGVQTLTLDARTSIAFITPNASGDVIIDRIIHGSSNTGARVLIVKQSATGRVLLRDGNVGVDNIWTPGSADYVLALFNDATLVTHSGSRWFLDARKISINDQDYGDVTVSNSGQTWTIDNDVVTFAKMQNIGYGVIGNPTFATTVDPQLITPPGSNTVLQDNGSGTIAFRALNSTSIAHGTGGVYERAALTGAIAASQNSNATLFAGIRDNGSSENDRTNLNFLSGTFVTVSVADDAANDELEVSASLAPVNPGSVYGYQIDGAGTGIAALTGLEVGELLRFGTAQNLTLLSTTNDQTLNADTTVLRVTPSSVQSLTGVTGGVNGRLLLVENVAADGNEVVLPSLNTGSATANRWRNPKGWDITLGFRESALFRWDSTNGDWRCVGMSKPFAGINVRFGPTFNTGISAIEFIEGTGIDLTVSASGSAPDGEADVTVALADMAANSIKANATAGTAAPADLAISANSFPARIAGNLVNHPFSTLAGSGLSYSAGVLSVSATTGHTIRDNGSAETQRAALNFISSTSVTAVCTDDSVNGETEVTVQRAALTGAIAASANSNATVFAGIRDNGSAENDRTNLNFVSSTSATAVVTDDSGNDELEVTFQRAALTGDVTASANSNTTAFRSFSANSVLANATAAGAVPTELAISASSFPARVGGNLVSHPFSTLVGNALSYNGAGVINVETRTDRHIFVDTTVASNPLAYRKSSQHHYWYEDFDYLNAVGTVTTSGTNCQFQNTTWGCVAVSASGFIDRVTPTSSHPGVISIATGATSGNRILLFNGTSATPGDRATRADGIQQMEFVFSISATTSIGMYVGFLDGSSSTNSILFVYDTASGHTTIQTQTQEAGVATVKDTGVSPGTGFRLYRIRQETAQTIDFYIDDVLETTHTSSENVPDTETGSVAFMVITRTAATRTMNIDYAMFESQDLGTR